MDEQKEMEPQESKQPEQKLKYLSPEERANYYAEVLRELYGIKRD